MSEVSSFRCAVSEATSSTPCAALAVFMLLVNMDGRTNCESWIMEHHPFQPFGQPPPVEYIVVRSQHPKGQISSKAQSLLPKFLVMSEISGKNKATIDERGTEPKDPWPFKNNRNAELNLTETDFQSEQAETAIIELTDDTKHEPIRPYRPTGFKVPSLLSPLFAF
jgi:hypothetical protein